MKRKSIAELTVATDDSIGPLMHGLRPRPDAVLVADAINIISPRSARTLQGTFESLQAMPHSPGSQTQVLSPISHYSSLQIDLSSVPSMSSLAALSPMSTSRPRTPPSGTQASVVPFTDTLCSSASVITSLQPSVPSTPLALALPDSKAFDREASIEKKRRSSTKSRISSSRPSLAPPRPPSSSTPVQFAAPAPRTRHQRPPSTPMKTPASVRADIGSRIVYQNERVNISIMQTPSFSNVASSPRITRSVSRANAAASTPTRALFRPNDESDPHDADVAVVNISIAHEETSQISFGNFESLGELGRGDFGVVYKALSRDHPHQLYAIKKALKPFRSAAETARGLREVEHFKLLLNSVKPLVSGGDPLPHIVFVYRAWIEENYLYIQSEYLPETLRDVIVSSPESISEDMIWDWTAQLLQGLEFIHSRSLYHLDIKPSNIFRTSFGTLKIGDLGTSLQESERGGEIEEGDAQYIAPEMLDPTLGPAGPHSDVFSLGLTLFEIAADVVLPSRGEAWNQLRHEVIDWNGTSWFPDSPISFHADLASPDGRPHIVASAIVDIPFSSPSASSRMSPLVMEPTLQSSNVSSNGDDSVVMRRLHSGRESPVVNSTNDTFGPAMSPISTHPSRYVTDDEEDIIRTPIVRTHMARAGNTPHSRGTRGHLSSLSSPAVFPSCFDSPHATPDHLYVIKRRHSSLASAAGSLRSACLRSFITDMLRRDPAKRPTISQLLCHPNVAAAMHRRSHNQSLISRG